MVFRSARVCPLVRRWNTLIYQNMCNNNRQQCDLVFHRSEKELGNQQQDAGQSFRLEFVGRRWQSAADGPGQFPSLQTVRVSKQGRCWRICWWRWRPCYDQSVPSSHIGRDDSNDNPAADGNRLGFVRRRRYPSTIQPTVGETLLRTRKFCFSVLRQLFRLRLPIAH